VPYPSNADLDFSRARDWRSASSGEVPFAARTRSPKHENANRQGGKTSLTIKR
jgi:hypothetical protein